MWWVCGDASDLFWLEVPIVWVSGDCVGVLSSGRVVVSVSCGVGSGVTMCWDVLVSAVVRYGVVCVVFGASIAYV